jgi:aminocarboxymuconate-semialdehyde decarboxylase
MTASASTPVIDTHAHWYPRGFIALLERDAADNGAAMGRDARGNPVLSLPTVSQKSTMVPEMIDAALMVRNMKRRCIDVFAVSLTNPMVYWAPPAFGLKLSRAWNDACAELHTAYPDRFVGTMMLPMQAPGLALQELERAAKLPGMRALYLAEAIKRPKSARKGVLAHLRAVRGAQAADLPAFAVSLRARADSLW